MRVEAGRPTSVGVGRSDFAVMTVKSSIREMTQIWSMNKLLVWFCHFFGHNMKFSSKHRIQGPNYHSYEYWNVYKCSRCPLEDVWL